MKAIEGDKHTWQRWRMVFHQEPGKRRLEGITTGPVLKLDTRLLLAL
jgi:hypothetical protein